MKLASLKWGRDGRLVVVSNDLAWCVEATNVAPTLQTAPMLILIAFAALFAWVVIETVARNRPRPFAPAAPPPDLLP